MTPAPTIPDGYRLVSGPHTAAEVEEGWTICAKWTDDAMGPRLLKGWTPRSGLHIKTHDDNTASLYATVGGFLRLLVNVDDPDRDIYRIEKVTR